MEVSGQFQDPTPSPEARKETPRYLLDMRISVPCYRQGIDSFPPFLPFYIFSFSWLSFLSFLSFLLSFFLSFPSLYLFIYFLPSSEHEEFFNNTEATYSRRLTSLKHTCICNSYSVIIKPINIDADIISDRSQEHSHVTLWSHRDIPFI